MSDAWMKVEVEEGAVENGRADEEVLVSLRGRAQDAEELMIVGLSHRCPWACCVLTSLA